MEQLNGPLERLNRWVRNSVTLKLLTISVLALMLLIPSSLIISIIDEREQLSKAATAEVSSKWANAQLLNGPILTLPLILAQHDGEKEVETVKYLHILPDELTIKGEVYPEKLRRGIYEVVVYKSVLKVSGQFNAESFRTDYPELRAVQWNDAFLTVGISDLRGIEEDIVVKWAEQNLKVQPGSRIDEIIASGITVELPELNPSAAQISFAFDLKLQGSQNLSFVPLGSLTTVELQSPWPSPSFNGSFLPDQRNVDEEAFSAKWTVLQLNRNFPQQWLGNSQSAHLQNASFGIDLLLPVDDYQKSMRSAKYAQMTIALTFLVFFLVEIMRGRKIHPFQYTLVGLALCLFYILLLSLSEHISFNLAYLLSVALTVSMIGFYSLSIFREKRHSFTLTSVLIGIYGFLFITLQLSDYALLMGTLGLAIILSAAMYFTRNINWYDLSFDKT